MGLRTRVVGLIADGKPEQAMRLLSQYYGISEPDLRVGTVRRHRRVVACYVEKERRIYLSKSDFLTSPYVILHEFYHHLRASNPDKRRQVEKRADLFASTFIRDFMLQQRLALRGDR
jgi:hypothetical protein